MNHRLFFGAAMVALAATAQATPGLRFAPEAILGWESHSFEGQTSYELVETDQGKAVHAQCEGGSASGLFRRKTINLEQTPIIEWRWRVDEPANLEDETSKSGDDFAARVYAVNEHTFLRWRTRAISYVWASEQPRGSNWENPTSPAPRWSLSTPGRQKRATRDGRPSGGISGRTSSASMTGIWTRSMSSQS